MRPQGSTKGNERGMVSRPEDRRVGPQVARRLRADAALRSDRRTTPCVLFRPMAGVNRIAAMANVACGQRAVNRSSL
jgi:hypothetical protein